MVVPNVVRQGFAKSRHERKTLSRKRTQKGAKELKRAQKSPSTFKLQTTRVGTTVVTQEAGLIPFKTLTSMNILFSSYCRGSYFKESSPKLFWGQVRAALHTPGKGALTRRGLLPKHISVELYSRLMQEFLVRAPVYLPNEVLSNYIGNPFAGGGGKGISCCIAEQAAVAQTSLCGN